MLEPTFIAKPYWSDFYYVSMSTTEYVVNRGAELGREFSCLGGRQKAYYLLREHSYMTSDVFWAFLTYLPTLIRYFTT